MADFNVSLSGPSAAGANPVAPVHQASKMNTAAPFLNLASGLVGILATNMEENKKQQKLQQQQAIIGEYTTGLSTIASAVETGELSAAEASARKQAFHRKHVASYPMFAEEFGKVHKNLSEFSVLANVDTEQKSFQDAEKKLISDMNAAGYPVSFGMDKNILEANKKAFLETQKSEGEFKRLAERTRLNMSLQGEQRTQFEFDQKQEANKLLAAMGDAHMSSTMANVQALVSEFDKTGDVQGSSMKLQAMFTNIDSTIAALSSANPTAAKAYKDLFDGVRKLGEEGLKPGKNAEVWAQKLKLLENQTKFAALSSSPEAKTLYSSSYLFHGNMPSTFLNMNTDGKNAYASLSNAFGAGKVVPQVVGTDNLKGVVDGLQNQIGKAKEGKIEDVDKLYTQAGNAANNILKQVGNAGGLGVNAKALVPAVSFLASPEFFELHSKGNIDPEALQSAKQALKVMHSKEVVTGIEKRLAEPIGNTANGVIKGSDKIELTWSGAGVVAQAKKGGAWLNPMEAQTQQQYVRELGPVATNLNMLIKSGAHMEGHKDYQKYWEDNKHLLVPSYFPDPVKLKVGQVVDFPDGSKREYIGGNFKDEANSWKMAEQSGNSKFKVEERKPFASEDAYFKANPQVAGMASEDDKVVMNPYSTLKPTEKDAVRLNETARVFMRTKEKPTFEITPEQDAYLATTAYKNAPQDARLQTVAARILSGDPSIKNPTKEQLEFVKRLKKAMGVE